jgi:hypothetical protein
MAKRLHTFEVIRRDGFLSIDLCGNHPIPVPNQKCIPSQEQFYTEHRWIENWRHEHGKKLQGNWLVKEQTTSVSLTKGMEWGLIGGIAGTMAMDLVQVGALSALGMPTDICFSTIGSTAARFFSLLGIKIAGSAMLGVAMYHLIGPGLGAIYGLAVSQVCALQGAILKKNVIYAVLYAEVLSQLILALMPVLLKMSAHETILWFGGSFVLHLIWGVVLGFVMRYGLRLENAANSN